jgi:hypothetical protein
VLAVEDPYVLSGHQQDHPGGIVGLPHPGAHEVPGVAQRHPASVVNSVVADPVALDVDGFTAGPGIGTGPITRPALAAREPDVAGRLRRKG